MKFIHKIIINLASFEWKFELDIVNTIGQPIMTDIPHNTYRNYYYYY